MNLLKNQEKKLAEHVGSLCRSAISCFFNKDPESAHEIPSIYSVSARLDPIMIVDYQKILIMCTDLMIKVGDLASAATFIEKACLKNVNESEILFYKGVISELKGDFELARETYEKILLRQFKTYKVYLHLALLHIKDPKKNNLKQAKIYLDEALKLDETPEILYYMGEILAQNHDTIASNEYLTKALVMFYKSPVAPYDLISQDLFKFM